METIAGVFRTRDEAVRAINGIEGMGVDSSHISLLAPGNPHEQVDHIRTTDAEAPGMGSAVGAVVGGAGGAAIGAGIASALIPGVGWVAAAGFIATALLMGAGGAAAGAAAGSTAEQALDEGIPKDEIFVYEDAVRQGRTVVLARVDEDMADTGREKLRSAGAESIDAAREAWWGRLRSAEEQEYNSAGWDFESDEPAYRNGFESALDYDAREGDYHRHLPQFRERYPDQAETEPFRRGFERGRGWYGSLIEEYPPKKREPSADNDQSPRHDS